LAGRQPLRRAAGQGWQHFATIRHADGKPGFAMRGTSANVCQPGARALTTIRKASGESEMAGFRKRALLAALGFAFATSTLAQDQTYEEALAELRSQFRRADVNGDGKLSQQEVSNAGMSRLASNFRRVDTDRDGFVTLPQLEARLANQYGR